MGSHQRRTFVKGLGGIDRRTLFERYFDAIWILLTIFNLLSFPKCLLEDPFWRGGEVIKSNKLPCLIVYQSYCM